MHKTYLYIVDSYKKLVPVLFIDYAFRVCQQNRQQVSSSHRLETQPVFLMGKTGLRQFQAIVVTWGDTSCLFGTDIEMLYNKQHSIPAIYIPLHLYNQFLLICS